MKKILPIKVEYFSKIEEIFPYCPNGQKLKIHVENLDPELILCGHIYIYNLYVFIL